jgi:DNA-binding beta-propeller fold protein YncE
MSKIALSPDDSGTGTFTLASPNSNTNRTLTLPDAAGELLTTTGDGSGLTGVNSFKPVAVTGTTPSLDVGSYNYFDNGTLSGDTTVTFASVPTEANWRYSFNAGSQAAWDISIAVFLQSFSIATEDTNPRGIFFKPDGTKMYMIGVTGDNVNEYDLSTAWDVSTASYLQLFSVTTQDTLPNDLFFKPDGTKMYVVGETGDAVYEYNLSTAWDVTTAVFSQLFSVASQEGNPHGLFFKPDGTKMYVAGNAGDDVNQYDLSTAWDVTTAVFSQLFSVAAQDLNPQAIFFKPDGTKMYMISNNYDAVHEYSLSVAWNVSSAIYLQRFSTTTEDIVPTGIFFKSDGTKMYVVGSAGDNVNEYDLGSSNVVTLPASVENPPLTALSTNARVTYEFVTLDGGTTVNLIAEEVIAP